ncbi:MAG: hypothetical protein F6K35_42240, partial [Okeania sp. SIO2H7]|nr:hypothetical protein [Okeania sp. SIO2H7]
MRPGFLLRPSSRAITMLSFVATGAIAGIPMLDGSQIRCTDINAPGNGMKGH